MFHFHVCRVILWSRERWITSPVGAPNNGRSLDRSVRQGVRSSLAMHSPHTSAHITDSALYQVGLSAGVAIQWKPTASL